MGCLPFKFLLNPHHERWPLQSGNADQFRNFKKNRDIKQTFLIAQYTKKQLN